MQIRFNPKDINIVPRITVRAVPQWYTRAVLIATSIMNLILLAVIIREIFNRV